MISNQTGNSIEMEAAHHSLQWNTVLFSQVNLIYFEQPSFVTQFGCSGVEFSFEY